jgi:hypothetical protein
MKKIAAIVLVLGMASAVPLTAKDKNVPVDMSKMSSIFLGWVDMNPDHYRKQGYSTKAEYAGVIRIGNTAFQDYMRANLPEWKITAAKDREDMNTAGNDLYIKFADVDFTHGYSLYLAVTFIDLRTNSVIATIPHKKYTGRLCGLEGCMRKELEEVARKIRSKLGKK